MKAVFITLLGSFAVMVGSIILFLVKLATTDWVDLTIDQFKYDAFWFCGSSVIVFFLFLVFTAYIPAKIHNDQENTISEYRANIDSLKNTAPDIVADGFDVNETQTTEYSVLPKTRIVKDKRYPWLEEEVIEDPTSTTDTRVTIIKGFGNLPDYKLNFKDGKTIQRYFVKFRNKKIEGKGIKDADDVHAKVQFYSKKTGLLILSHEKPRWLDYQPHERIKISTSLKTEGLYLVAREKGYKKLYVFNQDSYSPNLESIEPFQKNLELKEDEYYIHVMLGFDGSFHSYWFFLINPKKDKKPIFSVIEKPNEISD